MKRWFRRGMLCVAMLSVAALAAGAAHAAEVAPDVVRGFDSGSAVSTLTDATANENGPAAPFMGLASKIEVDPLFGTATATIPVELPAGRKVTPDLTIR